jgi:hypothetical protein
VTTVVSYHLKIKKNELLILFPLIFCSYSHKMGEGNGGDNEQMKGNGWMEGRKEGRKDGSHPVGLAS